MIGDFVTFKDCQKDKIPFGVKIIALGHQDRGEENAALVCIDGAKTFDIIEIDDEIVGIHLTPEILEKNGWVSDNYNDPFRVYNLRHGNNLYSTIAIADDGKWSIEVNKEIAKKDKRGRADGVVFIRDWCNEFYVHELQHALRLCGIEKKIVI